MEEIMNVEMQKSHIPLLQKWLRFLLYLQMAGIVMAILNLIPGVSGWTTWLSYFFNAGMLYALFMMAPSCIRYRKSAVYRAINLISLIFVLILKNLGLLGSVITLAGSVCGIIASYQEYHGHGEVVKEADQKLEGQWRSLFIWQMIVGVVLGVGTAAGVIISAVSGGAISTDVGVAVISLPSIVLQVVYLVYLNRTLKVLQ